MEAGYIKIDTEQNENVGSPQINENIDSSQKKLKLNNFYLKSQESFCFLIIFSLLINIGLFIIGLITFGINFNEYVLGWDKLNLKIKFYLFLFFSSLFFKLCFIIIILYCILYSSI